MKKYGVVNLDVGVVLVFGYGIIGCFLFCWVFFVLVFWGLEIILFKVVLICVCIFFFCLGRIILEIVELLLLFIFFVFNCCGVGFWLFMCFVVLENLIVFILGSFLLVGKFCR